MMHAFRAQAADERIWLDRREVMLREPEGERGAAASAWARGRRWWQAWRMRLQWGPVEGRCQIPSRIAGWPQR